MSSGSGGWRGWPSAEPVTLVRTLSMTSFSPTPWNLSASSSPCCTCSGARRSCQLAAELVSRGDDA